MTGPGLFVSSLVMLVPAVAVEQPNVVMIVSDDQAYTDFGFMGHPTVRTPHIDRLAARAAQYTNAYVPSSVCRPSLATLLTGLYPHQAGVGQRPIRPHDLEDRHLPVVGNHHQRVTLRLDCAPQKGD